MKNRLKEKLIEQNRKADNKHDAEIRTNKTSYIVKLSADRETVQGVFSTTVNRFLFVEKRTKKSKSMVYESVKLWIDGEANNVILSRLIAFCFVPIPEQYSQIDVDLLDVHHIDGNHNNNNISNLEWLTKSEHSKKHKIIRTSNKNNATSFVEEHSGKERKVNNG